MIKLSISPKISTVDYNVSGIIYEIGDFIRDHNTIFDKKNKFHLGSYKEGYIIGFNMRTNDDPRFTNYYYYRITKVVGGNKILKNSWLLGKVSIFNKDSDWNVIKLNKKHPLEIGYLIENELSWNY